MVNLLTIVNFAAGAISILLNLIALSLYPSFIEKGKANGYLLMTFFQFLSDFVFSIVGVVFRMELAILDHKGKTYVTYYLVYWDGVNISFNLYSFLVFVYFIFYYLNLTIVTSAVVCRYLLIVKKVNLNQWHFLSIIIFNAVCVIGLNANFCLSGFDPSIPLDIIYQNDLLVGNNDDLINEHSRSASLPTGFSFFIIPYLAFFIINFVAILFAYVQYNSFMIKFSSVMSASTKKVNEEYLNIIRLQLIVPLFLSFAPLFTFCWFITLSVQARYWGSISLVLGSLTPTLTSILYLGMLTKSRKILILRFKSIASRFSDRIEKPVKIITTTGHT
uniref:G_PROTEIN_RECEP_F1_2 domain-containing protein n=1 Tax=Rhabditophanes sp. KR3021 TaxID=114890 RepID=A0AC35TJC8_9BILA